MPDIKPFRGLLYNTDAIVMGDVVALPYDVISPSQQEELYRKDPANIVRLILNRDEDPYSSAARTFAEWQQQNVLIADHTPSLYVLAQRFADTSGTTIERRGFIAACRLEEIGKGSILPHEKTHSKAKEDRFKLFQATGAMFSQIFGLYSDPSHVLDVYMNVIMAEPAHIEAEYEGVLNRLWLLKDAAAIAAICDYMKSQKVPIADGHHRYETALMYRNSKRENAAHSTGEEAFNFVPMFFTNTDDPGLVIYPTHRIVHSLPEFDARKLLQEVEQYFTLTPMPSPAALVAGLEEYRDHAFGLVLPEGQRWTLLTLKENKALIDPQLPGVVTKLDVSLLHRIIITGILHISEEQQEKMMYLEYERDTARAFSAAGDAKTQAVFLMNPPRIEQVRAVTEAGHTMPQKSTFFYPKLLSGMVTYSFIES